MATAISNCRATSGFTSNCDDLLRVGGLDRTFWIGYKSQLDTQISLAQTADIGTLDFGSYGGLLRFDGNKFAHSFTDALQVAGGSGNRSYKHTLTVKLLPNSTADDVILQQINLGQDMFAVVQDNNRKFFILGAGNGLASESDERTSGETADADTRDTVVLSGSETTKALRFALGAGYDATLAYLVGLEL
jgi:hypothetical protein